MPSSADPGPSRHAAPSSRRRRIWTVVLISLALIATTAAVGGALLYRRLEGNITARDVQDLLGPRPVAPTPKDPEDASQVNILVMGSDTRVGNREEGRDDYGPPRSDTTILLHLAEGRGSAVGVSIPRDSIVDLPECRQEDGKVIAARPSTIFNEAFENGAGCTFNAVEQLTGVRIDHYVVVDFAGFKNMVDALGGVPICLPEAVTDKDARLDLEAGRQNVKGDDALAYVRSRKGFGDGSDLGRIDRQQTFISSMIQKATDAGMAKDPVKLVKFLDAATASLTTDPGLASLNELRKLGQSVNGIPSSRIEFLTIPNEPDPADPNRVVWSQPEADAVWTAIRTDQPVPGTKAAASASPKATAPSEPLLTTRPEAIRVRVVNAGGTEGAGTRAAGVLRAGGFTVTEIVSGDPVATTTVRHSAAYDESGRTLAAAAPGADITVDDSLGRTLELVIGPDFGGATAIPSNRFGPAGDAQPTPTGTPTTTSRTAQDDICT